MKYRVVAGAVGVLWMLGCSGMADMPTEDETDAEPEPAPEPDPGEESAFGLEPWQDAFAEGRRDIRDHLMLLPRDALVCEDMPPATLDEAGRDALVKNKGDGWMELESEGWTIELKLFEGSGDDMLALNLNCGMGCMCNRQQFRTWDDGWSDVSPLDEGDLDKKVQKLKRSRDVAWFLDLPRDGDETAVVDDDGKRILGLAWQGGAFAPKR